MYFFIEFAKLIKNISDDEFSQYHASFPLFFEHHKRLGEKWKEYLEKNEIKKSDDKRKKWQQTIREIRYWEDQELDYMYGKIMSLSRQILGKKVHYFTVETFSGKLTIPDRIQILNRLIKFSDVLLSKIYPSVTRLVNYKIDDDEIISSNIRGSVNWGKTIQHAVTTSGGNILSFVSNLPKRSFQTPENILLLLAVRLLFEDSKQIMAFQNKEYVSPEDKKIVWDVVNKTQKILNEPLLSEIKKNTKNIDRIIQNPIQIKKIAKQVEKNLEENKKIGKEYHNLLDWIENYIDFNVNRYQNLSNFTLENIQDVDTMFELWVLFEFVTYMKKVYRANVNPIVEVKKGENKLKGFEIEVQQTKFYFMYDKEYNKIPLGPGGFESKENKIKPDFTFEFGEKCLCGHEQNEHLRKKKKFYQCESKDGENTCECDQFRRHIPIVLDAKNWRKDRMEALRVSAWYLTNLNKYQTKTGVLLFSNYDGKDPSNPETGHWGPMKINQGDWEFINYVVKSSQKNQFREQLEFVFEEIITKFPAGVIKR